MSEQSGASSANLVLDPEAHRLNLAVVESAQQVVDLTNELRVNGDYTPLKEINGVQPEYEVMYSVGDPELPVIVMHVAAHGSDRIGDMQSAKGVSWSVSAHMPKSGRISAKEAYHHKLSDMTVAVTASTTHPDIPTTQVYDSWFDSLGGDEQYEEEVRRHKGEAPTLASYASKSREAALEIMRKHAEVGKYSVPEHASDDEIRACIDNPAGLKISREWFDNKVGGPVLDRLALASALELLDGISLTGDPVGIINQAIKVQRHLIDPDRQGPLSLTR